MREIVHIQAGQCGNQIGAKVYFMTFVFVCLPSLLDAVVIWRIVWSYIHRKIMSFIPSRVWGKIHMSYAWFVLAACLFCRRDGY